jgi:hypothetical protein
MVYLHRIIMIDTWNYYIKWSGLFDGLVGEAENLCFCSSFFSLILVISLLFSTVVISFYTAFHDRSRK